MATATHPSWCDLACCLADVDDGDLYLTHRAVFIDRPGMTVVKVQAFKTEAVDKDGTLTTSEGAVRIEVRADEDGGIVLDYAEAIELVGAIAAAAAAAAGITR